MGKTYTELNETLINFIKAQKIFFVGSAPLAADGHVNVSPKGYDSFAIIDNKTVAFIDFGGSGIETHAHILENGRVTIMFNAFEGKPNIVRLYGQGETYDFNHPKQAELLKLFPNYERARAVILLNITRISDSCGYGVPFYKYVGEREQLIRWVETNSLEKWKDYAYTNNAVSIDGLPGISRPIDGQK